MAERKMFNDKDADKVWVKQFGQRSTGVDVTGRELMRTGHGRQWEVDHIKPIAKGGMNHLSNLQVLHSAENAAKGDDYPLWRDTQGRRHRQD